MKTYVDEHGKLYDVDDDSEDAARAYGLFPATEKNIADHNLNAEYGSTGQQAIAAGEAVVRGATFGQVEGFVGDEQEIRDRAAVFEDKSPILSGAAEFGPDVALGLATGGLSALGTGALKIGGKAALKVGVKSTIKAGGKAGAAAALAGESLGSGAVAASQEAFDRGEQFFHDDIESDVSNLMFHAGLNAVVGGAALGAGKLLGKAKAARKAKKAGSLDEAVDALPAKSEQVLEPETSALDPKPVAGAAKTVSVEEAVKEVEEGVVAKAMHNANDAAAELEVSKAVRGDKVVREAPSVGRSVRLARDADVIRERAIEELRPRMNEIHDYQLALRDGGMRREDIVKNIGGNKAAQIAQARHAAQVATQVSTELIGRATKLGRTMADIEVESAGKTGRKALFPRDSKPVFDTPAAPRIVQELRKHAIKLEQVEEGADAFDAIDNFKRMMQKAKNSLEGGKGRSLDPDAYSTVAGIIEKAQEPIRVGLEREDTWSSMGKFQAARNLTYTGKLIPNAKAASQATSKLMGRDYNGNMIFDALEENIEALMKNEGRSGRRYVGNMLDAMEEMAVHDSKFSGRGTGSKRVIENIEAIRRTFSLTDEVNAAEKRLGVFNNVTGIAGAALQDVKRLVTGETMKDVKTLAGVTSDSASRSVDDWFQSSRAKAAPESSSVKKLEKKPGRIRRLTVSARRLGRNKVLRTGARRALSRDMAEFMGEGHDSPVSAYRQLSGDLLDDEKFIKNAQQKFSEVGVVSPNAMALMASQAFAAKQFLLSKMPPAVAVSMSNPNGYPPNLDAIEDWAVYVNAVRNPMGILDSLGTGNIRVQQVEVLKALPTMRHVYEDIQSRLLQRMAAASRAGESLDDQLTMRLSLLFDLDGGGTPAFSASAAAIANSAQPEPGQGGPSGAAGKPVDSARAQPSNPGMTGATYGTEG